MENKNSTCEQIGKGHYVLAEYDKIKRITMPLGEHLLYITTDVEADHSRILDGIRKIESG